MTFIETIPEAQASGAVGEFYAQDRENSGYVVESQPDVLASAPRSSPPGTQLIASDHGNMDRRRYELATLAAARHLRSSYCMLPHSSVLLERFCRRRAAGGRRRSPRGRARSGRRRGHGLRREGRRGRHRVTQADVDGLRALGLTDAEVLDVVLAAAARSCLCKAMDGVGTQPDSQSGAAIPPDLREALTIGRPSALGDGDLGAGRRDRGGHHGGEHERAAEQLDRARAARRTRRARAAR